MICVYTCIPFPNFELKSHNVLGQARNTAVARTNATMRTVSRCETIADIVTLFGRFESLYADLPLTKKHARELDPDVLEKKVIAICSVREEIKARCKSSGNIDICITTGRLELDFCLYPAITALHIPLSCRPSVDPAVQLELYSGLIVIYDL